MFALLLAFALVPLLMPLAVRVLGARAFFAAAVLPAVAFVHTALQGPAVLSGHVLTEAYDWIPALGLRVAMRMDALSWVMALIVTGVGTLVLVYCRWYFDGSADGLGQFTAVLLGFAGAMYGLVLVDDIIVLVMLWETTSILSYLLIGFYHRRGASRRSALQALLVTSLGGLCMLVGATLLSVLAGTTSLSGIVVHPPTGPAAAAGVVLVLVGALSKSAIFPFHFWLPGAMAAPTPVSAFLHAAAMVKAGVYLIVRLSPAFAVLAAWRDVLVPLGLLTLLVGGLQALRETDLKRLLAAGTISQLGLLTAVLAYGIRDVTTAGMALLLSHALFKSCLFLVVGVIDRQLSTRDMRRLSGLGRRAPLLAVFAVAACASMAGFVPTIGFVGKEAAFTGLLAEAAGGAVWAGVVLVGILVGSMLTMAYAVRFAWGAFARKTDAAGRPMPDTEWPGAPAGFLIAPVVLGGLTVVAGLAAPLLDGVLGMIGAVLPASSVGVPPPAAAHLALWHGFVPALWMSVATWLVGAAVFAAARAVRWHERAPIMPFSAVDVYNAALHGIARAAVGVTRFTQRGSLPVYAGTVFAVLVAAEGTALVAAAPWRVELAAWHTPAQVLTAPVMIIAGMLAVRARRRYAAVVLVSVTGMGMIVLFATSGAPDLALTQVLVETVTLVVFALVLRRLPVRMGAHHGSSHVASRTLLAAAVGLVMAGATIVATGARHARPISDAFPRLAYELGHGRNVVNVVLVDLRGWDTMGELSVLVLAATGVASLVFVTHRTDTLSGIPGIPSDMGRSRLPLVETPAGLAREGDGPVGPRAWLVGGVRIAAGERSVMLEVIVRLLFHTLMVVSVYLLFAGHNLPGGGFAAGLVAGMALVMRYLAGGRHELGAASPVRTGWALGVGMLLAVGCAAVPLFVGAAPLTSTVFEADIPVLGHVELVTSTIFDIGVYLVVVGLVMDVLRSLGAEVDRQADDGRTVHEVDAA